MTEAHHPGQARSLARQAMGIVSWWRQRVLGEGASRLSLELGPEGLRVRGAHADGTPGALLLAWSDIAEVVAFKRDLFGTDRLCAGIGLADGRTAEVDETMDGWQAFARELPRHLPGALPFEAWFARVAFPAFEPSPVTVYRRQPAPHDAGPPERGPRG